MRMVSDSKLIGSAGEHFVMSALLRQGYIAALAPEGAPNIDILVSDIDGNRVCAVQVKSRSGKGSDGGWHMRPKHEELSSEGLYYCFVNFSMAGSTLEVAPEVYVIPSKVIAKTLKTTHQIWLRSPGKNGRRRKDHTMRRLLPDYSKISATENVPYQKGWMDEYRNAWHHIGHPLTANGTNLGFSSVVQ